MIKFRILIANTFDRSSMQRPFSKLLRATVIHGCTVTSSKTMFSAVVAELYGVGLCAVRS